MNRRLIVNADDYGMAEPMSAGIRHAHHKGIVTSTTTMMNKAGAAEAVRAALEECPNLGLGVHLVLTSGRPVLLASSVRSITALGEEGAFPKRDALLAGLATVDLGEVEAEWRAQIEAFVRAAGHAPTHLDSHHHASFFSYGLCQLVLRLAREHDAAIRMPLTTMEVATKVLGLPPGAPAAARALDEVRGALEAPEAAQVKRPDHFEPRFYGAEVSAEGLNTLLANLPEGVTELMCHPALDDPRLDAMSAYGAPRAVEFGLLTQPGLRSRLAAEGIELISFRDL